MPAIGRIKTEYLLDSNPLSDLKGYA